MLIKDISADHVDQALELSGTISKHPKKEEYELQVA